MTPRTLARIVMIGPLMAFAIAGCSMASSSLVETDVFQSGAAPQSGADCSSSSGAYSLSRSYLAFEVHENVASGDGEEKRRHPFVLKLPSDGNEDVQTNSGVLVKVKPDPATAYCLDYLRSSTSDDLFEVEMEDHLLTKIATEADDKSKEIAENLVQALFVGLSGNPDTEGSLFRTGRPSLGSTLQFTGVFDPFDHQQVNQINDTINRYGFCMFVEGQPVAPRFDNVDAYCENPLRWRPSALATVSGNSGLKDNHAVPNDGNRLGAVGSDTKQLGRVALPPLYSRGIFYRPRLPHTVYLYVKENLKLKGRDVWKMRGSSTVLIENTSPVFNVAVDRTYFANRKTTLDFDAGSLRDIRVEKSSELANFVTIPLQIAKSIAALPTAVIMIKIDQDSSRGQLIAAQNELIFAQRQLAAAKAAAVEAAPAAVAVANAQRSGQFTPLTSSIGLNQCVEQCSAELGGTVATCQNFCSCKVQSCRIGDDESCSRACKLQ
jgi:hypothetical protein